MLMTSADFFKITFSEKFFQEYHQSVSLDPNQARPFVGLDPDPNSLQRLPDERIDKELHFNLLALISCSSLKQNLNL